MKQSNPPYLLWLAIAVTCIFAGRAYDYLFWGSPIRVLFWDQTLFSPVVEFFGTTWEEYAANLNVDRYLERATYFGGFFFILCAITSSLLLPIRRRYLTSFIYVGSGILFCHALLEMKDHFYHYGQLFEHSIQVGAPVLFAWAVFNPHRPNRILFIAKILIALTFAAHGLYAIGFYPVPGHFLDMTINILACNEDQARLFLQIAGVLDMVVAVGLFIPKIDYYVLIYAVLWGLATALARIVSGFDASFLMPSLHSYVYKTVLRLAHGLVPLAALLLLHSITRHKQTNN